MKSTMSSVNICFKVCTISFERPVNYLCDAWHVFRPKYEAWTHFTTDVCQPWTDVYNQYFEYLIIRSAYLIIPFDYLIIE